MSDGRFGIVIFGATGFVGKYAIENLVATIDQDGGDIRWAVAGRDEDRIRQTLRTLSGKIGKDITAANVITADVDKMESIKAMTSQAKVIVNCVGPYRKWGNVVLESCIATGTHHVDVSGEPQFLEGAYLKFFDRARESKVLIVGACAFESLPMEMAVCFMRDQFAKRNHTLNSVEGYFRIIPSPDGWKLNHGTWDSMLESVGNGLEVLKIKKRLYNEFFKKELPEYRHEVPTRVLPFRTSFTSGLNMQIYDIDMETSKRTNTFHYNELNERPVYVAKYLTVKSIIPLLQVAAAGILFGPLIFFGPTRNLLMKYPKFFSFGLFSKEGPNESQVEGTSTEIILKARGWSRILKEDVTEQPFEEPDKTILGRIKGPEMTYPLTSQCAVQSAITIVKERDSIPYEGGVFTPGVAFRRTNLISRLGSRNKNPVFIELIE